MNEKKLTIAEFCTRIEAGGEIGCTVEAHYISCLECPFYGGGFGYEGECGEVREMFRLDNKSESLNEVSTYLYNKYGMKKIRELFGD
jgi:hypothetical protein